MKILHAVFEKLVYGLVFLIVCFHCSDTQNAFHYNWQSDTELVGPEFLAFGQQDWHVHNGRLETTENATTSMHSVYLGNKKIGEPLQTWSLSVEAGWQNKGYFSEMDSNKIGLVIGINDNGYDLKNNLNKGFFFGVESNGKVIIKNLENSNIQELASLENTLPFPDNFLLSLSINYENNAANMLFEVQSLDKTTTYASIVWVSEASTTAGNIALVADLNDPKTFRGCWFNNFSIEGQSVVSDDLFAFTSLDVESNLIR